MKLGILDKNEMEEAYGPMYECMANDISKQRKRLGAKISFIRLKFHNF